MPLIDMDRLREGVFIDYAGLADLILEASLLLTQECSSAYARRTGANPKDDLVFLQMYAMFGLSLYLYGIKLLQARLRDDYDWPSKQYDSENARMLDAFMERLTPGAADSIRVQLAEPRSTETVKEALISNGKQYNEVPVVNYVDKVLELVVGA